MSPPSLVSTVDARPLNESAGSRQRLPSAPVRLACHHCGLPVSEPGRWTVQVEGRLRETCCAGCQAVTAAITGAGLHDYYRARGLPAPPPDPPPAHSPGTRRHSTPTALYDDPEVAARFVRTESGVSEATLLVDGLRCGACSWLLEQALGQAPGIVDCSVNLASERASLRWDPSRTRLSELIDTADRFGFALQPFDASQREKQLREAARTHLRRLFVAGIGMMQVMMYAFPAYIAAEGDIEPAYAALMRWASLLLTLPVVLYSAAPIFRGAWKEWQRRSPGMDTPVAIGIGAAFAASVWATVTAEGEVWFDTVTMFVFLLLGARHLEWLARLRASRAIDTLAAAAPQSVLKLVEGAPPQTIAAARLQPGERFLVGTGEPVAVDAALVRFTGSFDLSLLTGESRPVDYAVGDRVPGGAINLGAPAELTALTAQADSTLSTIARLASRAAAARPALLTFTETVARGFTIGLLALAAVVWLVWHQIAPDTAWSIAIAVLVVSCPCALSLATPAALAAASATALRRGMIAVRGDALEAISRATDVVFDKTGTLTRGEPTVAGVEVFTSSDTAACLGIAAALETSSTHPLGRAIVRAARASGNVQFVAVSLSSVPGEGVEGQVNGRHYRLGRERFALTEASRAAQPASAAQTGFADLASASDRSAPAHRPRPHDHQDLHSEVWLSQDGLPLARIALADTLREEAPAVVAAMRKAGLTVHLVSGDRRAVVSALADRLDIGSCHPEAAPADKLAFVQALQSQGRRVLAVGDGMNDAPLLAAANVSIAMGCASTLARTSASVALLGSGLDDVTALRALALRTRRVIIQNLGWALAYNIIAIPAAAFGWIAPWAAALGMSASSLLVAGNALRLLESRRHHTALSTGAR